MQTGTVASVNSDSTSSAEAPTSESITSSPSSPQTVSTSGVSSSQSLAQEVLSKSTGPVSAPPPSHSVLDAFKPRSYNGENIQAAPIQVTIVEREFRS